MTRYQRRPSTPVACDCAFRHEHGTRRMYVVHKCGCLRCRAAHATSKAAWIAGGTTGELRHVDATATRRRIEGLAAIGWSHALVAERLGCTNRNVALLRGQDRVHVATAGRIADVYDQLVRLTPPAGWRADRTRREAAAKGWATPFAWDTDSINDPTATPIVGDDTPEEYDPLVVDLVLTGRITFTQAPHPADRAEIVHRLTEAGHSIDGIAYRLQTSNKVVRRLVAILATREDTAA